MDMRDMTAMEIGKEIREGRIRVGEAVEFCMKQIEEKEPKLNAFISVCEKERLQKRIAEVEQGIKDGVYQGGLAGVPVAVKDNICTVHMPTTCASRMLEHFVSPYQAEVVRRLENAGAVIIGKTNMDEFAMGSTSETSAFGPVKNPCNPEHVPGGSSGGSCAAVSSGECFYALGSDTGGSIRQPSAYCNVAGMKPTYGTVSRYGLIAYGSSFDQIGPIARNVEDCACILETIAGYDRKDSTCVKRDVYDFMDGIKSGVEGLRIGIPEEYLKEGLQKEIREAVKKAAEWLKECGAKIEYFSLGLTEYTIPSYYLLACAQASSNLERFDGVKYGFRAKEYEELHEMYKKSRSEGFGMEVKQRILLGSFVLSSGYYDAYYLKALRARTQIKQEFDKAFAKYDVLLGPVTPTTAPPLGESLKDPLAMYLGDIYTVPLNLAGLPGMSLPFGVDGKNLPIGLQIFADCFQEKKIFRTAYTLERAQQRREQ